MLCCSQKEPNLLQFSGVLFCTLSLELSRTNKKIIIFSVQNILKLLSVQNIEVQTFLTLWKSEATGKKKQKTCNMFEFSVRKDRNRHQVKRQTRCRGKHIQNTCMHGSPCRLRTSSNATNTDFHRLFVHGFSTDTKNHNAHLSNFRKVSYHTVNIYFVFFFFWIHSSPLYIFYPHYSVLIWGGAIPKWANFSSFGQFFCSFPSVWHRESLSISLYLPPSLPISFIHSHSADSFSKYSRFIIWIFLNGEIIDHNWNKTKSFDRE